VPAVPRMYSADPKRSATSSQGIRGYSSVMSLLKFSCISNKRNKILVQTMVELF